jgi:hypothetical protein
MICQYTCRVDGFWQTGAFGDPYLIVKTKNPSCSSPRTISVPLFAVSMSTSNFYFVALFSVLVSQFLSRLAFLPDIMHDTDQVYLR